MITDVVAILGMVAAVAAVTGGLTGFQQQNVDGVVVREKKEPSETLPQRSWSTWMIVVFHWA